MSYPSVNSYLDHYQKQRRPTFESKKQRGGAGKPHPKFGNIYVGERFPPIPIYHRGQGSYQQGEGVGTILSAIARGIGRFITNPPGWLKEGAKIVGTSGLKAFTDYKGDVDAGLDKGKARKRAFRSAIGDIMEQGGKALRGGGKRRKRMRKCC